MCVCVGECYERLTVLLSMPFIIYDRELMNGPEKKGYLQGVDKLSITFTCFLI